MTSETRRCQNCKKEFTIEPEDFAFYERIQVPPPTWCPECRSMRRMTWRNEKMLYKRKCGAPGHAEDIISLYPNNSPFTVYDAKFWWSDGWNPMDFGRDYDFSRPFFEQFHDLMLKVPRISMMNRNSVGSEYCNNVSNHKNCYMEIGGYNSEDVMYTNTALYSKDSVDTFFINESEKCYELLDSTKSYHVAFGRYCDNCLNSWFLYDCRGCSNCFGCAGLRNKQYCWFNEQLTKEEYERRFSEVDLKSYKILEEYKGKFKAFILSQPMKFAHITKSENVTGNDIENSNDLRMCFFIGSSSSAEFGGGVGASHGKYLTICGWNAENDYDCMQVGGNLFFSYEIIGGAINSSTKFAYVSWNNANVAYSENCYDSSNLFGCAGLRNKQYCILNKQYSKEEYEELIPRIVEQMNEMPYVDSKERIYKYGEFFPPELSPFVYNETIAQEYFPLNESDALSRGFKWKEPEEKKYQVTMKEADTPDSIDDAKDSIVDEIIECAHRGECNEQCTAAFRIIPQELSFYRRMGLPLPHLCFSCRHAKRLEQRKPLKLWHRRCQCVGERSENGIYTNLSKHTHGNDRCPSEFETPYAPERKEIVYCESCYNSEVV